PPAERTAGSRFPGSRLPDGLEPGMKARPARGDSGRALVVRAAVLALDENQRCDHQRQRRQPEQVAGAPRNQPHGRPLTSPRSSRTCVFSDSAFITNTVRKPSAIASGTWVRANTPANFRNAPVKPLAASG